MLKPEAQADGNDPVRRERLPVRHPIARLLLILLCTLIPVWAKPVSKETGTNLLYDTTRALLSSEPFSNFYQEPQSPEAKRLETIFEDLRDRYRWLEDELALPGSTSPLTPWEAEELLQLLKAEPDRLYSLGIYLPRTPQNIEWAVRQFEGPDYCPEWLLANYPPYRSELVERASDGGEISLNALAMVDWAAAKPLIDKRKQSEYYVSALRAQLRHKPAAAEARRELLAIVRSPKEDLFHRIWAIEALLQADDAEADELFAWALEQPFWFDEGGMVVDPFDSFARRSPAWQTRLRDLVTDPRPAVGHNARMILANLVRGSHPDEGTVRALLPCLSDPDWMDASGLRGSYLFEALSKVHIPEAVPALLHILRTDQGGNALSAAEALESYNPPEFRDAWEEARKRADTDGSSLAEVGIRQGWFTVEEQVDAVAQFLQRKDNLDSHTRNYGANPQDHLALTCLYDEPSEALTEGLVNLARTWYSKERPQLTELEDRVLRFPGKAVDEYMLERVESGDVSVAFLRSVLARRSSMYDTSSEHLARMAKSGGPQAGVALVLLDDTDEAALSLEGDDTRKAVAVLACAKIVSMPLSPASLKKAYEQAELKDPILAYLKTSEEQAHTQLLKEIDGGYLVTGRTAFGEVIQKQERELVARFRAKGSGEVFALQTLHEGHRIFLAGTELWIDGDHAVLRFEDNKLGHLRRGEDAPSYEERTLTQAELKAFRGFIEEREVDSWPQWIHITSHHETSYQYLHLTPSGGRRVGAVFNEASGPGAKYGELIELFQDLKEKPSHTIYQIQKEIPGIKVLDDHSEAMAIFRDSEGLKVREKDWRNNVIWRFLTDEGLGGPATPAQGYAPDPPEDTFMFPPTALANGLFLSKEPDRLVVREPFERPDTFLEGEFSYPVLDDERRQGLIKKLKSENGQGEPEYFLVDFITGQVRPVEIPADSKASPLAFIPGRRAFLAAASEGYRMPARQGYLVDSATGDVSQVEGDFRPWLQPDSRPLQEAGAGHYWTTLPTPLGTEVGTVDVQTLAFSSLAHYPGLRFDATQMWIEGDRVYVTLGDVLELPIKVRGSL